MAAQTPIVQVAPGNFPEPQQRAINDALGRLAQAASAATVFTPPLVAGATSLDMRVNQSSASYTPTFTTSWFTMVKVTAQTAAVLTLEFSTAPATGDTLKVVIQ